MLLDKKITVLGSGIMGHGIAQISAMAGYNVTLRDIDLALLNKALEKVKWSLSKLVEKHKITQTESETILSRISPEMDLKKSLVGTDMIIEAVPEDLEIKRKLYAEVDRYAEEKTIYASNTSTLPITEMAVLTKRPGKFVGLHFFNPPQLMRLVEVIPGRDTSPDTTSSALDFVMRLGKESILCKKDVVGFIVNRIFIPLVHEAAYFLDRDGVTMTQLDSAVKYKMGFPMGIFELADYTGLDVIHKATLEMYARDKKLINPHPRIKQLVDSQNLGKKTGKGFYDYNSDSYERINLSIEEAENYSPVGLLAVAANNAAWLLSNDVCTKTDLDRALNLGMGLKTELFESVKKFGVRNVLDKLNEMSAKFGSRYQPSPFIDTYAA